jgi:oxygen-independent coproporphyrinogen-3 oxidase
MEVRFSLYQLLNMYFPFEIIQFNQGEGYDYKFIIQEQNITIYYKNQLQLEKRIEKNFPEEFKRVVFKYLEQNTNKVLPWGILSGIRPTKQIHKLMKLNLSKEETIDIFKDKFLTSDEKAKLCYETAIAEKEIVNDEKNKISIYIGIPFCPTRCVYCSFTSNPISKCKKIINPYLDSLYREIDAISKFVLDYDLDIQCVYLGGGTPTSLSDEEFHNLIAKIFENFVENKNVQEFNVECGRPDSITLNKLNSMKEFFVNRISINPQTMNDETLKKIGRSHTSQNIVEKFNMARQLGFDNINMDLIIGLPGENISHVEKTIKEIKKLNPDSITIHGMSIKRASKLHEDLLNNKFKVEEQNNLNQMFELTRILAEELDMKPYYLYRQKNMVGNMENLGYAKIGKEGIYNIQIIEEKQTIIALGADAVTKIVYLEQDRIDRVANLKDVREYTKRIDEKIKEKLERLQLLQNHY